MTCSIICPVLINSPSKPENWLWLEKCVHSIKKNSKENHEIIVVTNNGEKIECPIKGIKQLHTETQGQCIAVNIGVKNAQNEYVMIIDEDFIFPTNWEELTEKTREYDFVSGYLMERGGSFMVNSCGGINDFDEQKFEADALMLKKDEWENGFGFPLICKKSIWELVEGYDEGYDPWGSNCDSDLEYKLMLAGIMPKRWKGTLFYHFASVSGTFADENHSYWQQNIRRFEEKWGLLRANSPHIWSCDFIIDGDRLRYKPSFAKLENNPYVYYKKFKFQHVGWVTNNIDLFERFWVDRMGFKRVYESEGGGEMYKTLFDLDVYAYLRRYEKDGIVIEVHWFNPPVPEDKIEFYKRGINHACIWVDDRERFLKLYPWDKRVFNNPKGHQNVFIRDIEGNWIEIYATI
jgi:glycosyltransferase involved in cell wall biosynthesis